ncbi:MAG: shikimate kinase [Verrucomicrobia bacterium]|nr:shikimate kinase [Verrucomicrobiota bacterium]
MQDAKSIVLIGFMGTGKSSVGKALAKRLDLTFLDMDAVIEEREGIPISEIFTSLGEAHFRALERALTQELAESHGLVIATGGGIVLNPDNARDFSRKGLVVCLQALPETILARVAHETHRPLLANGDKLTTIRKLLAKRQALYDALPHEIDTDGLTVDQVAARVIALYRHAQA